MNLTGLHLLLSYKCTHECDHCFVWGSPFAVGTMTLSQIRDIYRQAAELATVRDIPPLSARSALPLTSLWMNPQPLQGRGQATVRWRGRRWWRRRRRRPWGGLLLSERGVGIHPAGPLRVPVQPQVHSPSLEAGLDLRWCKGGLCSQQQRGYTGRVRSGHAGT